MILYFDYDELYPNYYFSEEPEFLTRKADVPEEVIKDWKRVLDEFNRIQKEMKEYHDSGELTKDDEVRRFYGKA